MGKIGTRTVSVAESSKDAGLESSSPEENMELNIPHDRRGSIVESTENDISAASVPVDESAKDEGLVSSVMPNEATEPSCNDPYVLDTPNTSLIAPSDSNGTAQMMETDVPVCESSEGDGSKLATSKPSTGTPSDSNSGNVRKKRTRQKKHVPPRGGKRRSKRVSDRMKGFYESLQYTSLNEPGSVDANSSKTIHSSDSTEKYALPEKEIEPVAVSEDASCGKPRASCSRSSSICHESGAELDSPADQSKLGGRSGEHNGVKNRSETRRKSLKGDALVADASGIYSGLTEDEQTGQCPKSYASVVSKGTKLEIICGQGARKEQNHKAYIDFMNQHRKEYCQNKRSRESIAQSVLDRFCFFDKDGQRKNESEAKDKVHKSLIDHRILKRHFGKTLSGRIAQSIRFEQLPSASQNLSDYGNPHYIEELAFHCCVYPKSEITLECLPSSLPDPVDFPEHGKITWVFDAKSRVLHADFTGVGVEIPATDQKFFGKMMERDDITLVSKGLFEPLSPAGVEHFLRVVEHTFPSDTPYHKFRRFDRVLDSNNIATYQESDGFASMTISHFMEYLRFRKKKEAASFVYQRADGKTQTVNNVMDVVFYMIDVEMEKFLHHLDAGFKKSFKVESILPGGSWCMMTHVPPASRPFMGPNCYITPAGGFTQVHQDGHGTVDSGHCSLSGYNEVVMLRRLPEVHKRHACSLVPSLATLRHKESQAQNMLYSLPHDDGREDCPGWPNHDTIAEYERMGYAPSVFTLEPGQHVHINKGRLHAFRKATVEQLHEQDCHFHLREHLRSKFELEAPLCISIAWDWMFLGVTADGINREVAATLECASECRRQDTAKTLAIPEAALHKIASVLCNTASESAHEQSDERSFPMNIPCMYEFSFPSKLDVALGILPSLRHIIEKSSDSVAAGAITTLRKETKPDSFFDYSQYQLDPYGNDYFCAICFHELSNSYFHCNGCDDILKSDFNICSQCYFSGKGEADFKMSNSNAGWHTNAHHHIGKSKTSRCSCESGNCLFCHTCTECSCRCHGAFTEKFRFYTPAYLVKLLKKCEHLVGDNELKYSKETECRLAEKVMIQQVRSTDEPNFEISHASEDTEKCEEIRVANRSETINADCESSQIHALEGAGTREEKRTASPAESIVGDADNELYLVGDNELKYSKETECRLAEKLMIQQVRSTDEPNFEISHASENAEKCEKICVANRSETINADCESSQIHALEDAGTREEKRTASPAESTVGDAEISSVAIETRGIAAETLDADDHDEVYCDIADYADTIDTPSSTDDTCTITARSDLVLQSKIRYREYAVCPRPSF